MTSSLYMSPAGPAVHYDQYSGTAGTVVDTNGTADNPVNNEADMKTLATALGYRRVYMHAGLLTLASGNATSYWDWHFHGSGVACRINTGGKNLWGANFWNLSTIGDLDFGPSTNEGADVYMENCYVGGHTGITGTLKNCIIHSTLSLPDEVINTIGTMGGVILQNCTAANSETNESRIDFVNGDGSHRVLVQNFSGALLLRNMLHADIDLEISMGRGKIIVEDTCLVQPTIEPRLRGDYEFDNQSNLTGFDHSTLYTAKQLIIANGRGSNLIAEFTVAAGGDATEVHSDATKADNYYDRMFAIVSSTTDSAARRIRTYSQTDGAFTLESALPFTPTAGDTFRVVGVGRDDPIVVGST